MTDARDVIARAIADYLSDQETWVPTIAAHPEADSVLAALAAAGLSITETPDEWEWGVRWDDGEVTSGETEDHARKVVSAAYDAESVVRRRPAQWEIAP